MKRERIMYCGVDVSKDYSDYALHTPFGEQVDRVRRYGNDSRGLKEVCRWLERMRKANKGKVVWLVMEATGVYHLSVANYFSGREGFSVSVVNPARVKRHAESSGTRTKTDSVDARVLASFGRGKELQEWVPPTKEEEEIISIVRQVEAITEMIQQERNRLEALRYRGSGTKKVQEAIRVHIEFLQLQQKELKEHLRRFLSGGSALGEIGRYIRSIVGIGDYTACVIIAEAGRVIMDGNKKQLVAHAGISPSERSSGKSVKGKTMISRQGAKRLRKLLFMPTLVAIQHNPVIRDFYQRLLAAGKSKKCALIACMRKLLHIVWGVVRNRTYFDPHWERKKTPQVA